MGQTKKGNEVQEIIWATVPDGDRGDTRVPGLPDYLQHCGGCSSNGSPTGILRTSEGTPRIWLGGGENQFFYVDDGQIAGAISSGCRRL